MSSYDAALIDWPMIDDPRLVALPRGTRLLHVEAIVWSRLHKTDGRIPRASVARLTDEPDAVAAAEALADAGLWEEETDGWYIAGFLDRQMSAEQVERKRQQARERYDRWQAGQDKRAGKRAGKRVDNAVASDTDLTRPDPKGKGRGRGAGRQASAGAPAASRPSGEKPPTKAERETVERMLEGELCWFCANEPEPFGYLMQVDEPAGGLARRHVHTGECDPLPFPDWAHCDMCAGVMPPAWLHHPDWAEDDDYTECRPGRGCGGAEAELRRTEQDSRSTPRECPGCGEVKPGSALRNERIVVMDDGSEVRALVCGDCDLRAEYPDRYGGSGDAANEEALGAPQRPGAPDAAEARGDGEAGEDAPAVGGSDGGAESRGAEGAGGEGVEGRGADVGGGQGESSNAGDNATTKRPGKRRRQNLR